CVRVTYLIAGAREYGVPRARGFAPITRQWLPVRFEPPPLRALPGARERLAGQEWRGACFDVFFDRRVGAFHAAVPEMPAVSILEIAEPAALFVRKFGNCGTRRVEQHQVEIGLADHDAVGDIVDDRLQQGPFAKQGLVAGLLLL